MIAIAEVDQSAARGGGELLGPREGSVGIGAAGENDTRGPQNRW